MSIPATMKFIVRGKSVDLKNREGSSPSIPKKTIWLPNYFSYPFYLFYPFFLSGSKFLIFSFSFTTLYTNGSQRKCCSLITYDIYDTCTNEHLWARNPHLNDSRSIFLFILKLTKLFFWQIIGPGWGFVIPFQLT